MIQFYKTLKQEKLNYSPVKKYILGNFKKWTINSKVRRVVTFRDRKMRFGEIHKYTHVFPKLLIIF